MDALKKIIANEGPMSHEYVDAGAPENQFVTEGMTPKQASKQLEEMQAYMEVVDQEREALHGDARDDLAKLARDTQ